MTLPEREEEEEEDDDDDVRRDRPPPLPNQPSQLPGVPPSYSEHGYPPPQHDYPPPQQGYPPPQQGYPPPQQGYPPPRQGYPSPQRGYPPPQQGYPPPQQGYPPPQQGYPPPQAGYPPPQQGYPPPAYDQPGYYQEPTPVVVIMPEGIREGEVFRSGRRTRLQRHGSDELGNFRNLLFDDNKIRLGFIRKVYCLLMIMLFLTMGLCAIFMFVESANRFIKKHWWIVILAMFVYMTIGYILICCQDVRRRSPFNVILLIVFAFATAIPIASLTALYDVMAVLMAFGTTFIICFLITLCACQSKVDVTGWGGYLFVASIALIIFCTMATLISIFFVRSSIIHLIIAGIGTVFFSVFLLFDTQQIIGGRRVEISPEEYVFGAMQLYLDIIMIFSCLMKLFGTTQQQ